MSNSHQIINRNGDTDKSCYYLPKLLNPLVDSIFNCPDINKSLLKKLYNTLNKLDDFIVIVPPTDILLSNFDTVENCTLRDLCYSSIDFISNHIIFPNNNDNVKNNKILCVQTIHGKNIVINQRHSYLFTSNGFAIRQKYHILRYDTLINFNNYYHNNNNNNNGYRKFLLIYIDQPVLNHNLNSLILRHDLQCFNTINNHTHSSFFLASSSSSLSTDKPSFEKIIISNSQWLNRLNDFLINYRNSCQYQNGLYITNFNSMIDEFYLLIKNDPIFNAIDDLKSEVKNYFELQLYDYIWDILKSNVKKLLSASDKDHTQCHLNYLSLDQLQIDLYKSNFESFKLSNIIQLEKNISLATAIWDKIFLYKSHSKKCQVLVETLQSLSKPITSSNNETIYIDADTLINLFVLILNKYKLHDLKCILFYLQNFFDDENDIKFGLLGYSISTLEASIKYLDSLLNKDTEKLKEVQQRHNKIKHFIEYITGTNTSIDVFDDVTGFLITYKDFLKYRSDTGQSILSYCIQYHQNDIIIELLSNKLYEKCFPLEDLLDDETIDGSTLLIQCLKYSNDQIASVLVDIFLSNCSVEELQTYFKRRDKEGRSVAHYLNGQIDILDRIGQYIEWDSKDCMDQTPLFTIFRSYDQINYDSMVSTALNFAKEWYQRIKNQSFLVSEHIDSKGNSLLHIMKSNVAILLNLVDGTEINRCNNKGMTPLMVYVKYNRVSNVETILQDPRIDFDKKIKHSGLHCFDLAQDENIIGLLGVYALNKKSIFKHIYAHSLKSHNNSSYSLKLTINISQINSNDSYKTFNVNFRLIKNFFKVVQKKHPLTFLPLKELLIKMDNLMYSIQQNSLRWIKLQERETILSWITLCLDSLIHINILPVLDIFKDEFILSEWIQKENSTSTVITNSTMVNCNNEAQLSFKPKLLEPEQVNTMQNFLKFNLGELKSLIPKFIVLKSLGVFLELKSNDIIECEGMFKLLSGKLYLNMIEKQKLAYPRKEVMYYGIEGLNLLLENLEFMELCILKPIQQITELLDLRISEWWKLYREFLSLKKYDLELKKLMDSANENVKSMNTDAKTITNGLTNIIGNIFEKKNSSNKRQINEHLLKVNKILKNDSKQIKKEYEQLAEELSKFVLFKSEFFKFGIIKLWGRFNIELMKQNLQILERKQKSLQI